MIRYILLLFIFFSPLLTFGQGVEFIPSSSEQIFQFDPNNPTGTGYFEDGGQTNATLPTDEKYQPVADQGTFQFRFLVERLINTIKFFMIPIAMVVLAVQGVTLMSVRSDPQEFERAKQVLQQVGFGFLIMTLSVVLVDSIFLNALSDPEATGRNFNQQILGIFDWASGLVVAVSVLFLTIGAFQLMIAQGSDDAIDKAKSRVLWSTVGIVLILTARTLYNLFTHRGGLLTHPDAQGIIGLMGGWTNFILSLVAFFALLSLLYGGAQMIFGFGNEESQATARKIVIGSVIGLIIAMSAFVISSYLTRVF